MENTENGNKYLEIVEGSVANRNVICDLNTYKKTEKRYMFSQKELYRSYYTFDDELRKYVSNNTSVKNFTGKSYINKIILDVDKGTRNCEELRNYVIQCIEKVINIGIKKEHINVWYSGSGYHLELLNVFGFKPSNKLDEQVKFTLTKHFDFADSIYDKTRIIRSNWSYNLKTKLHKIWIPIDELHKLSADDIKRAAKSKNEYQQLFFEPKEWFETYNQKLDIKPYLDELIIDSPEIQKPKTIERTGETTSIVTCMQHVYNEGPIEGNRNMKMMRMASTYKRAGIPYIACLAAMQNWNAGDLGENEVIRSVTQVYEGNYQYGCSDYIMSEYCDPKCIYYKRKNYTLDIKGIDELENAFKTYMLNDFSKQAINLGNIWSGDNFTFKPGELIVVSGDTGMGKSAFVQNIITKAKRDTLFLSLEMAEALTFRRFVQIAAHKSKEWVNNTFTSNPNASFKELLGHIKIMTVAPEIESIKKVVGQHAPTVLVIDTTDEIQVDYVKSEYEKQNIIIDGLKNIAQRNNTIVIAVHHVNKASAVGGQLGIHSLKGSSNIVQKADKVLMLKGARDDAYRTIKSEKSRDESSYELITKFVPETFTFEKVEL